MKIKINDKIYIGRFEKRQHNVCVSIPLFEISDIQFFYDWNKLYCFPIEKGGNYKKDFLYESIAESGVLGSCYPILDINEEYVDIFYDYTIVDVVKKSL